MPTAQVKASIRRAAKNGRARMHQLDKDTRAELRRLYSRAREAIEAQILAAEDLDGTIRLERLQGLRNQLDRILFDLDNQRDEALITGLRSAVETGASPFAGVVSSVQAIAEDALQQTVHFVAADGLQLSDRIWRLNQQERAIIADQVERAIIQGDSAARAAREFVQRNVEVPAEIRRKIGQAQAAKIAKATGAELLNGDAYANALRLFRTEINRAHGEAFMASAFDSEDVIGTRFLLSPNHPKADICDMHAKVNRYGLGPGVYPKGKNPWPAHPNTLSFVEVVFADEVSDADRAGQEDRISWLKKQSPARQQQILNGRKKRAALLAGHLKESQITTPWQTLKKRYQRQGIDTDALSVQNVALNHVVDPVRKGPQPQGVKVSSIMDPRAHADVIDRAAGRIDQIHGDGKLPIIPIREASSPGYYGAYYHGAGRRHIEILGAGDHKELTAIHEIGHFIDDKGLPGAGFTSAKHPSMEKFRRAVADTDTVQQLATRYAAEPDHGIRQELAYYLNPVELWARAYAQYIAVKSADPLLIAQLDHIRRDTHDLYNLRQWPDQDFAPVAREIDNLFKDMGWTT